MEHTQWLVIDDHYVEITRQKTKPGSMVNHLEPRKFKTKAPGHMSVPGMGLITLKSNRLRLQLHGF